MANEFQKTIKHGDRVTIRVPAGLGRNDRTAECGGTMKISVTAHDAGRSFRTTRERGISMKQALDIHDPFVEEAYPFSTQNVGAPRPCFTSAMKTRIALI